MGDKMENGKKLTCPAGESINGGCDVHCRIEGVVLSARGNDGSVEKFCTSESETENGHLQCPSWKTFKKINMTQKEQSDLARAEQKRENAEHEDDVNWLRERGLM